MLKAKPLSKTNQAGRTLYGVQLSDAKQQSSHTKQIWKSITDYRQLQANLSHFAFDLQKKFDGKIENESDQQIFKRILDFFEQTKSRPDIVNNLMFRKFYELEELDFQYLDQWTRVDICQSKDNSIVDFVWDSTNMVVFAAQKNQNKVKKLTSFFKQLLSKNDQIVGKVSVTKYHQGKWIKLKQIFPQAQPLFINWDRKSSFLHLATTIGIFIYSVSLMGKNVCNSEIIQFIKFYDIKDFQYASKLGTTFYCNNQKLYAHSLTKQYTMELTPQNLNNITSIAIQKSQERLFLSEENRIKIYSIKEPKQMNLLSSIAQASGTFTQSLVSSSDTYLFGLSSAGFITVFQIKPYGKEKLMSTLTNVDCPQNSPFLGFNQKNQVLIVSKGKYVILINTKNIPLYAGGNHKQKICAGTYDQEHNVIITSGEDGSIIFYNISMKSQKIMGFNEQ